MKNPYVRILLFSILLAAIIWYLDDEVPYPDIKDTIIEGLTVGAVYVVVIWCIMAALYRLFNRK